MVVIAAVVALACALVAAVIWRERQGRQGAPELDEALEELRVGLRRPAVVVAAAAVAALLLLATLARNPSRWPILLLALAVIAVGVAAFLVRNRGRD